MCGRFTLLSPEDSVRSLFDVDGSQLDLTPRYNVAPGQDVAIVRRDREGKRTLSLVRWGLVPFWAKDDSIGHKLINARAETVAEKPAFREAFAKRRCLIPADGFYEWRTGGGSKQPYHVARKDGAPFAFAGLWERWHGPDGELETCTIITTEAAQPLRAIHNRMPVILDPEVYESWLNSTDNPFAPALALLRSLSPAKLSVHPVSTHVNNPRNDDARCVEPLPEAPTLL